MSIQQAILFGGWNIPPIELFHEYHFNPNDEKRENFFGWQEATLKDVECAFGIAKQVEVIGKSCGDVG